MPSGSHAVKVLHVITGLGSGGAERQLASLVRCSDPGQVTHRVISLMDDGVYGADLRAAGVRLDSLNLRKGHFSPATGLTLARLMRGFKPDLVQTWLYHADLAGLLAAQLAGRPPVVWSLRCSDMPLHPMVRLLSLLSRWPAAVVANSDAGLAAHLRSGYHPRWSCVIPNGIDTEKFRPDPDARAQVRAAFDVPDDVTLVGCFARHDAMKDHAGLLAAFGRLDPSVRLMLAGTGTGPENEVLTAQMVAAGLDPKRLLRLGERRDVPNLQAALDLFVLGSAYGEGFPNAVAEAMACGLPVVATDTGDCRTIVGACGRVVPPRDPISLGDAMAELLALSVDDRSRLGAAARQRVITQWSLSAMVEAYLSLYIRLATPVRTGNS